MPAGEAQLVAAPRARRARAAAGAGGLGPVRRTNLSAAIADRIAENIAQGKLPAGSRLQSERELSDLFGVGRSSIREAIKALESRGLVEGRQGEGRFVRAQDLSGLVQPPAGPLSVTEREVAQLYEARRIVEPAMAGLAAERASDATWWPPGACWNVMKSDWTRARTAAPRTRHSTSRSPPWPRTRCSRGCSKRCCRRCIRSASRRCARRLR